MTGWRPTTVVVLSENPMHDTGGGQRSAQLALELLRRGLRVLFLSRGEVTETVDLGIRFEHPSLTQTPLSQVIAQPERLAPFLGPDTLVLCQVPAKSSTALARTARSAGAVFVYDLIDLWESELGDGWYSAKAERRLARSADLLVGSAPALVARLEQLTGRLAHLLPNAFNSAIFDAGEEHPRPQDLPDGRVALYVGALWGGWFDWDLVRSAAASCPETHFVFIGDHRGEGGGLPDNCVFLGLKPQTSLPAYLAHASLGFLPWKADPLTHATSPLKVYEFIAMGLPVVAPELEALSGVPGVTRAADEEAFLLSVAAVGREVADADTSARMSAFAAGHSWVQRVDTLLELAAAAAVRPRPAVGGPRGWISGLLNHR